jgi:hypothetical protein
MATMLPIPLEEVIGRGTPVHWDEAVAIVEDLCRVVIADSGEEAQVPALADILIGAAGDVTLRRSRGEKSPTAAGRALHALLVNAADVPMPLRLFVMQSTVPGTYGSVREFAAALSYYGKPDRSRLIQDVAARCAELITQGAEVRPASQLPAFETASPNKSGRGTNPPRRRWQRWALATASVSVVAGGAWMWTTGSSRQMVDGGASRVLSDAATALVDLSHQLRDTFNPASAKPAAAEAALAAIAPARPRSRARSLTDSTPDAASTLLVGRRVATARADQWQLAVVVPPSPIEDAPGRGEEANPDANRARVYSIADADVNPPTLLYPHVRPASVAPGADPALVNRMVVVVSTDGSVERVQFLDAPSRMPDMMLLSGAKTWKFTPAVKDGEPVRYQTVLSWSGLP